MLAVLLVALVCASLPPAGAVFTASTANPSTLAAQSAFPDYPAAVAASSPAFYYRGEDAPVATARSDARNSAPPAEEHGTYDAATNGPVTWWKFDEGSGTAIRDSSGAVSGTASSATWGSRPVPPPSPNPALTFAGSGTGGGSVEGTGPALDTSKSFTVSAWVNTDDTLRTRAAVSQDGKDVANFLLGVVHLKDDSTSTDTAVWAFSMWRNNDTAGPPSDYATAAITSDHVNRWVHLVGVFDATAGLVTEEGPRGTLALYVNGVAAGPPVPRPTDAEKWFDRPAPGAPSSFVVGRGRYNGVHADFWNGSVDDVRAFPRVLSGAEVSTLR